MAKRSFVPVLLLVLLLLSTPPSFSCARLFNPFKLAATDEILLLPSGEKGVVGAVVVEPAGHAIPCDMVATGKPSSEMRARASAPPRRAGKFGPLVLNMLPKGPNVPPSGPSKGINNINN